MIIHPYANFRFPITVLTQQSCRQPGKAYSPTQIQAYRSDDGDGRGGNGPGKI